jgi:hypothetical protein
MFSLFFFFLRFYYILTVKKNRHVNPEPPGGQDVMLAYLWIAFDIVYLSTFTPSCIFISVTKNLSRLVVQD